MGLHRAWKAYTVLVADAQPGQQVLDIALLRALNAGKVFVRSGEVDRRERRVSEDGEGSEDDGSRECTHGAQRDGARAAVQRQSTTWPELSMVNDGPV